MTPCIEWSGHKTHNGYGQRTVDGRTWKAHRYAWAQEHGPIPDGLFVCHHCDNRACVNVEHLFLGTAAQNNADKMAKGRGYFPGRPFGKLASKASPRVRLALALLDLDFTQKAVAEMLGISQPAVSQVLKRWK